MIKPQYGRKSVDKTKLNIPKLLRICKNVLAQKRRSNYILHCVTGLRWSTWFGGIIHAWTLHLAGRQYTHGKTLDKRALCSPRAKCRVGYASLSCRIIISRLQNTGVQVLPLLRCPSFVPLLMPHWSYSMPFMVSSVCLHHSSSSQYRNSICQGMS